MGSLNPDEVKSFVARHDVPIRTFVETGTHRGTTLRAIYESKLFETLHSIELSDALYHSAVEAFQGSGITLHHGDSAWVLGRLALELEDPVLFWLDAHWYDDRDAAKGLCPLFSELEGIAWRPQSDIVIIDDVQCFGEKWADCPEGDWTYIREDSILDRLGRNRIAQHYVEGYKLVVHRNAIQSG